MVIAQEGQSVKTRGINRDKENAFMTLQLIREDKTPTQKHVIFLSTFINSRRWCHSAAVRQYPRTCRSQGLSYAET